MNVALVWILLQIVSLLQVKFTWTFDGDARAYWNLYRAPLVTTVAVNGDGLSIPTDNCGAWRKLGNARVPNGQNTPGSGSWCYAVTEVHTETGTDLNTGLPVTVVSESAKSDVVVVEIP